ncbi:MAG TPA: MmoB/DmpM family protein [Polyangiaceae bacterium]
MLTKSPTGEAILTAIEQLNGGVTLVDRGAYVRVLVPRVCRLTRAAVESLTGEPFLLPADLERVMPSFKGRIETSEDEVLWRFDRMVSH